MLVIKKVNDHILDVFVGSGWSNWTRFEKSHKNNHLLLKKVAGLNMSKADFSQLTKEVK